MSQAGDMPTVATLEDVVAAPSCVTIGNFDGVHRGHQLLLQRTVSAAHDRGTRAAVVTFDPHPAVVLRPELAPKSLTTLDQRIALLAQTGIDLIVVLPFTRELSELTPEAFIQQVLVDRLEARRVIVGLNFRFGHGAAGDAVTLVEAGQIHGFDVEAVALRQLDALPVSSSAIRDALGRGDVDFASRALGRDFRIVGQVVAGDGRGRTIGVPTANLDVPSGLVLPAHGVYAGIAAVNGQHWPCVTNVGVRPTVTQGQQESVETHLLDAPADLDLYGGELEVTFAHHIRDEMKFASLDELVAQIRQDCAVAREWLNMHRRLSADGAVADEHA